ncbi:hypothetical protein GCM10011581_46290 [Saccharopolyspora subtropica]|uniref:Subtilisin inhibitor domain-containing protein n=1 Tax=Saccharopolyspora thermophila TaxID=89367 RepID=A0A917NIT2_9PSEU|nr:SSI family serine proteinase inhibitor [Saccharopolyspora subtropica]GGJ04012.1 hypothetical protein GCM10011581_46290 [Saccharopolyspora subtropica]
MAAQQLFGRAVLVAATLAGTVLTPALASAEPTTASAGSMLHLSVQGTARDDLPRTVVLTCDPAGGSHPYAPAACQTLQAVNGNLDLLNSGHAMCTLNYAPVTLTARGHWHNRPVTFEKTFPNACVAEAATGKVFAF